MHTKLTVAVLLFVLHCCFAQQFNIDLSQPSTPFPHFWEECVGSGHAELGLRSDWQDHLTTAHEELGFKRVRFHGLFDDDMSALLVENGQPVFSWFNIDSVFDFLVGIDMMPYVELSFMPEFLANGTTTIMHYKGYTSPPNNWTLWGEFITAFGNHIIDRYGLGQVSQWNFEVWNEPNCGFFNGDQAQYFQFYQHTVIALKAASQDLRVGGPATCQSEWLLDFIKFCNANNLPYDFVSTHEYPTDIQGAPRDILRTVFTQSREQVGPDTLLFYSEFNDGLYSAPAYHDTPYASSFLFFTIQSVQGIVDLMSWWTFTDIFEEPGQTSTSFFTADGWGLLNIYKVPKPSYRAFQLLHQLGTDEIPVTTTSNTTVGAWAVLGTMSTLDVIVYNFDLPTAALKNETVTITLSNLKAPLHNATLTRIDESNSNAPAVWLAQGSPAYPTLTQIDEQIAASQLVSVSIEPTQSGNTAQFTFNIPPWGSAVLHLEL